MTGYFDRCALAYGRAISMLATIAAGLGALSLFGGLMQEGPVTTLGALAAGWLFCSGLAAGGVAVSAAIRTTGGRWAPRFLPIAEASSGFFAVALGLLVALLACAHFWIPGVANGWQVTSLLARNAVATGGLFIVGTWYVRKARTEAASTKAIAVAYLIIYAGTLSLWAIDLVMSLQTGAPSTILPLYYSSGAFLGGLAWTALVGSLRAQAAPDARERHDLGKLLFGFVTFWAYLLWSEYLTVWYGNLPEETAQLTARSVGPWKAISLFVVVAVFVFPFLFLLTARTKRTRATLAFASAVVLVGLLAERCLLVLPSLPVARHFWAGALSAAIVAGVAGLFVLTTGAALCRQT
jgi:Ni/Fe-hydrogenase subunit HybB-like protein